MTLCFTGSVRRFKSKNHRASNIKYEQVLNKLAINMKNYMRDSKVKTKDGIVYLHLNKGHIVDYI